MMRRMLSVASFFILNNAVVLCGEITADNSFLAKRSSRWLVVTEYCSQFYCTSKQAVRR
jgi:hypothetical protein